MAESRFVAPELRGRAGSPIGSTSSGLLPVDSLAGMLVGVTTAGCRDLGRLGLFDQHVGIVLGEITRAVVACGGGLIVGGQLCDGDLGSVLSELTRYGSRDSLLVCLAWPEHRQARLSRLEQIRAELDPVGQLVCLDPAGGEVDPADGRSEAPAPAPDPGRSRQAMSHLRRYMRDRQHARVFIGGDPDADGQLGAYAEEIVLAVEAGQPIYLAGGFGGITAWMARALGIDDASWLPPEESNQDRPVETHPLAQLALSPRWTRLSNGLSDQEKRQLAATYRPGEIAVLVALGLGRYAHGLAVPGGRR